MQPLSIFDQVMATLHESLRRRGYAGLLLQSHIHLAGRIDESALQTAVERLGRVYPVVTGRLAEATIRRRPCWEWSDGAACPLTIGELDEESATVSRLAERLFATPFHLNASPPVHFHLLRKSGGSDVVVVQWSHVLMDGKGGELLLREVNRLHSDPNAVAPSLPSGDPLREHIRSHSLRQQLRGAYRIICDLALRGTPARIDEPRPVRSPTTRIALRWLDNARSASCLERVKRLYGFANLTPVLLAAAFRAAGRVAPRPHRGLNLYYTHVPLNNRPSTGAPAVVGNWQSYVRVQARPKQTIERDELARRLHRQLYEQLRGGFDLGFLIGIRSIYRSPRITNLLLQRLNPALTFVFGYHGAIAGLDHFCGTPVQHVWTGLPNAWSPPGLSFAANQFCNRLYLMASYVQEVVPDAVANAFLDAVVEELASS
jgi:hypothetical protein